jgi:ribose/xylose/arabinose/galactoside ABC-type transport system permease subunit
MNIPTPPLAFVGWFFAIVSFAALAIGILLLQQLFRSGKIPPEYLQSRIVSDLALLLVWLIGLVSAFGLLNGYAWGRAGLEYFCWVLIALTLLSGGARLTAYSRHPPGERLTPRGWILAVAGVMLVALPLVALCGVSILTLRSDQTRLQLEQKPPR